MDNITAYRELESELASKLEAQYQYLVFNGDIHGAYRIVGKLMAYKLIDRNDDRLNKSFKLFQKAGIDKEDRFKLDLRKDTNYIPEWLFADISNTINTSLVAKKHLSVYNEGYGDTTIVCNDRRLNVGIRLVTTPKKAELIAEEIYRLNRESSNKNNNLEILKKEVSTGFARVYEISITDKFIEKYRVLGYVILYKNIYKDGFTAWIALKHNILKLSYIDIKSAYKIIGQALKNSLQNLNNLSLKILINPSKDCIEQEKFMRDNYDKLNEHNKERENCLEDKKVVELEKARKKADRVGKKVSKEIV